MADGQQGGGRRVVHSPERQRYEILADGELAGFAAYQRTGEVVVFTHTEIDPRFEGRGLGGELVGAALADVRSLGTPVLPVCPFVQRWMDRHPEFHDLDYRRRDSRRAE